MKVTSESVRLSASDLSNHLACHHLTSLDLAVAIGAWPAPAWSSPNAEVLRERGMTHEYWRACETCRKGRQADRAIFISSFQITESMGFQGRLSPLGTFDAYWYETRYPFPRGGRNPRSPGDTLRLFGKSNRTTNHASFHTHAIDPNHMASIRIKVASQSKHPNCPGFPRLRTDTASKNRRDLLGHQRAPPLRRSGRLPSLAAKRATLACRTRPRITWWL